MNKPHPDMVCTAQSTLHHTKRPNPSCQDYQLQSLSYPAPLMKTIAEPIIFWVKLQQLLTHSARDKYPARACTIPHIAPSTKCTTPHQTPSQPRQLYQSQSLS